MQYLIICIVRMSDDFFFFFEIREIYAKYPLFFFWGGEGKIQSSSSSHKNCVYYYHFLPSSSSSSSSSSRVLREVRTRRFNRRFKLFILLPKTIIRLRKIPPFHQRAFAKKKTVRFLALFRTLFNTLNRSSGIRLFFVLFFGGEPAYSWNKLFQNGLCQNFFPTFWAYSRPKDAFFYMFFFFFFDLLRSEFRAKKNM